MEGLSDDDSATIYGLTVGHMRQLLDAADQAEFDCFLGSKPCGCADSIVVDNPDHANDLADTLAEFRSAGLAIEKVTRDAGVERLRFGVRCAHGAKGRARR